MAAKRFQMRTTRTEEEIEQLLHDESSKSTNKATDNAVSMWLFHEVLTVSYVFVTYFTCILLGFVTFCNKVVNWHPCIVLFWVGRYNKTRGTLGVSGKQNSLFLLGPVINHLISIWQFVKFKPISMRLANTPRGSFIRERFAYEFSAATRRGIPLR